MATCLPVVNVVQPWLAYKVPSALLLHTAWQARPNPGCGIPGWCRCWLRSNPTLSWPAVRDQRRLAKPKFNQSYGTALETILPLDVAAGCSECQTDEADLTRPGP
ncbi:hypothetical protein VTK56DRAFT_2173 [Thermocarpiscus australiensis]